MKFSGNKDNIMHKKTVNTLLITVLSLLIGLWGIPASGQEYAPEDVETGQEIPLPEVEAGQEDSSGYVESAPEDTVDILEILPEDTLHELKTAPGDTVFIPEIPPEEPGLNYHPANVACPRCEAVNAWTNRFCQNCGRPIIKAKRQWSRLRSIVRLDTLSEGMFRVLHLRNGNIIRGFINKVLNDSIVVIETHDGIMQILAQDILIEVVDIIKLDGSRFAGPALSEYQHLIMVNTPHGVAEVIKQDIRTIHRYFWDKNIISPTVE